MTPLREAHLMPNRSGRVPRITSALLLSLFISSSVACAQSNRAVLSSADNTAQADAARASEHLKKLVGFGPHPSGSDAIKKVQTYLEAELKSYGLSVKEDSFNGE